MQPTVLWVLADTTDEKEYPMVFIGCALNDKGSEYVELTAAVAKRCLRQGQNELRLPLGRDARRMRLRVSIHVTRR